MASEIPRELLDEYVHTFDVLFELGAMDEERDNPNAFQLWHKGGVMMFGDPDNALEKASVYFDLARSEALRQFHSRHA